MVNNAAGAGKSDIVELDEDTWNYLFVSRGTGAFNLMHFVVPHMIYQGGDSIINVSSDGLDRSA